MLKSQENNEDVLNFLNAKLVKDYEKLSKKTGKNDEVLNTLELGTEQNKYLIGTGVGVFATPFAVGLSSVLVGMAALIPSADQMLNPSYRQAALEMGQFGDKAIKLGYEVASKSLPLIMVPVGVISLSVSAKLYKMLKDNKKKKNSINYMMINYIDDILENKDDDTLEFSKKIFKRVDLSCLSPKENLKLIMYLAYHRTMLKQYKLKNVTDEEVDEAYQNIIIYLEKLCDKKRETNNLKNNRFVNLLIDDYHEKEYEDFILNGYKAK